MSFSFDVIIYKDAAGAATPAYTTRLQYRIAQNADLRDLALDHIAGNDAFPEVWMHASELAYYCQKDHGAQVMHALFEGDEIDLGGRVLRVAEAPR